VKVVEANRALVLGRNCVDAFLVTRLRSADTPLPQSPGAGKRFDGRRSLSIAGDQIINRRCSLTAHLWRSRSASADAGRLRKPRAWTIAFFLGSNVSNARMRRRHYTGADGPRPTGRGTPSARSPELDEEEQHRETMVRVRGLIRQARRR
jgi:hypothetical protein